MLGDPREIERRNESEGFDGNLEDFTSNLDGILNRAFKNVKGNALSMALESGGGGELDFMKDFEPGILYNINGIYYNNHEALNYVWGAALKKAGMPLSTPSVLKEGFHAVWHGKFEGNEPEHNRAINRGYYNYPGRLLRFIVSPKFIMRKHG